MDFTMFMDEMRSLNQRLDSMAKTLSLLDQKIDNIAVSQRIGDETMRKSANSITIIVRLLAGLRKLSSTELRNILIESDALLNTVRPIPTTDQIVNRIPVTNDRLKTMLKDVYDILNSLPDVEQPLNQSSSTTTDSGDAIINKINEEEKLRFWRKYKNKYNYIEKIRCKLPPLENTAQEPEPQENAIINLTQNNINGIVQNDLNVNTQNDLNDEQNAVNEVTSNDVNGKFTIQDIIQNKAVYEMLKSRLKNSPYDDPSFFKNNVRATQLNIHLANGDSILKPVSCVAPLVVLRKIDEMCPIPLHEDMCGQYVQSTSNMNSNKRETRANTTKDKTDSSSTNVETSTKKRSSTIKNNKCEPSKKKKN